MNLDALAEKLLADIRLCDSRDEFDEVVRAALAQAERMGMERAANILDDIASGWKTRNEYGVLKDAATEIRAEMEPRFPNVYCSQCGRDFGPGDNGFSHCRNHAGKAPK